MMAALAEQRLTLGELLGDAIPVGQRGIGIAGLSMTSASIAPGDAFLAVAGGRRHGLEFAAAAIGAGASVVLYDPRDVTPPSFPGVPCIAIDDLGKRVGGLAHRFYGSPSERLTIAAITGTNGKTTVSRLVAAAGEQLGLVCGMIGTLGYGLPNTLQPTALTTPDAVAVHGRLASLLDHGAGHVAMEVSSHALAQNRVDSTVFDTAVFTNLSRDHLDYHGTMQKYLESKRLLFAWPKLRAAVVNVDDYAGADLARDIGATVSVTAVGGSDAVLGFDAIRLRDIQTSTSGLRVVVSTPQGEAEIDSPLLGDFNAINLSLALAVLLGWQANLTAACTALGNVHAVPGRMEAFGGGDQPLVVVDYAHTPDALENALRALRQHCPRDLWVMFGCGGERDRGKRPQMGEIAARLADHVVITDDNPRAEDPLAIIREIEAGVAAGDHVVARPGRRAAIEWVVGAAAPGDIVLLAGKGHEDYQLVGDRRLSLSDRDEALRLVGERA